MREAFALAALVNHFVRLIGDTPCDTKDRRVHAATVRASCAGNIHYNYDQPLPQRVGYQGSEKLKSVVHLRRLQN